MDNICRECIWTFETAQFTVECDVSSREDDKGSRHIFAFDVVVVHKKTGVELGSDGLWSRDYTVPHDFLKEHFGCGPRGYSAYFPDVVRGAIRQARRHLKMLHATHTRA